MNHSESFFIEDMYESHEDFKADTKRTPVHVIKAAQAPSRLGLNGTDDLTYSVNRLFALSFIRDILLAPSLEPQICRNRQMS
jgi:hypothetical protein